MASRALCRSVHRPARYLLTTRGFRPSRKGELLLAHVYALTPLPTSHFCGQSPFSASPHLSTSSKEEVERKEAETGVAEDVKESVISNTNISSSEELGGDGILDIPSPVDLMAICLDTLHDLTGLPCIMTLSQTMLFENAKFVAQVVGPKIKDGFQMPTIGQQTLKLTNYDNLLKDAGTQFNSGNITQAIELLENAIKEEPEEEQAYALLGLVYKAQKDWVNSAVYYKHAILKGKTDDFKIAAYAGCGLALLKEGAVVDCVETLRPIKSFGVPEHPDSRHCYYASLVILGRALLEAGLKDESQEIVQRAKELSRNNKSVEVGDTSNTL